MQSGGYWSSSTDAKYTGDAWIVNMWDGFVHVGTKDYYDSDYVWPVRSGQVGGSFDYYCDGDSDGHVSLTVSGSCSGTTCIPAGCQTSPGDDCNDSDATVHPAATEVCDGIDNNCDGQIDEGYVTTPTTCGVGICVSTGQLICQNGSTVDTCVSGQLQTEGPVGDATCSDLIDNDCDGYIDLNVTIQLRVMSESQE